MRLSSGVASDQPAVRWGAGRPALMDAALYLGSAAFAAAVALLAGIPLQREWGRLAAVPYAAGGIVAIALAVRRAGFRARAVLAAAVFLAATVAPLAVETVRRSDVGLGSHAQSEAIVTEEASRALLRGRDPYAVSYAKGPLAARPPGTTQHFPYLPGMIAFGLPRALDGRSPWADARIGFLACAVVAGGLASRRGALRDRPADALRALQALVVLPTGALLAATGGDDLPVIGLMLLGVALLEDDRPLLAGLALGLAAATKQTAWVLLPFAGMAAVPARRGAARLLLPAIAIPAVAAGAFALWDARAFVDDAIRFPLGLGSTTSAATTPTLGSLLIDALPTARSPLTAVFVVVVASVAIALAVRRRPRSGAEAAGAAAFVFLVALLLAPVARIGYLVYPIELLVWARALAPVDSVGVEASSTNERREDGTVPHRH